MTDEERKSIEAQLAKLKAVEVKDLALRCLIQQLEERLRHKNS